MRKLFKERKLFKGGNYMRKYGMYIVRRVKFPAKLGFVSPYISTYSIYVVDPNSF